MKLAFFGIPAVRTHLRVASAIVRKVRDVASNAVSSVTLALLATLTPPPTVAADASHTYIVADKSEARSKLPFSDAVVAGDTLYVAGSIGLDPQTGKVPADAAAEAHLVLDNVKRTIEAAGFKWDDLVSVQVFCTDLSLYDTFNGVYRTYFHEHFPARAFIGASQLVRGAHFEVMGTVVRSRH